MPKAIQCRVLGPLWAFMKITNNGRNAYVDTPRCTLLRVLGPRIMRNAAITACANVGAQAWSTAGKGVLTTPAPMYRHETFLWSCRTYMVNTGIQNISKSLRGVLVGRLNMLVWGFRRRHLALGLKKLPPSDHNVPVSR